MSPDAYLCIDCSVDTNHINELYMVNPELWAEHVGDPRTGMLCIGCLESRIGRKLNKSDFTPFPINNAKAFKMSERLKNRLKR